MDTTRTLEIILVEDDMNDAELAIHALKKSHLINNLIHLRDGEEAINFIFNNAEYGGSQMTGNPKLILLDLKMPGINGKEVLRRVKTDDRTRQIPVVVLTSSKDHPDITECYQLGANSYIVKPVEFENFSEAVTKIGFYWLLLNNPPSSF